MHHEVLLRQRHLQMCRMQPLLERHSDTKCFIDGKSDIEQIQAVNAQVTQQIALWYDCLAWNMTVPHYDIRDDLEGGRQYGLATNGSYI